MGSVIFATALGWMALSWSERGLTALRWVEEPPEGLEDPKPLFVVEAQRALVDFLEGRPASFEGLPLDLSALPPFQRRCLEALRTTRPGEILTYGELAVRAGSPRAARAVGQALRRNPLPILVPCHRVVGQGWAGGFSFGRGLETKTRLLALERP